MFGHNKILAYQAIRLFGSCTASGAEQVAAFSGLGSETSALVALGAAVDLREPLAVLGPFSPAALRAGLVAGGAIAFGLVEVVVVDVLGVGARDDLLPVDGPDVAEVVVVQDADAAFENVWKKVKNSLSFCRPSLAISMG